MSGWPRHPLYAVWQNMLNRCRRESDPQWKDYGGRGITVCDRWRTFENFLDDMKQGFEEGLTIERIDNDKGYEPGNCRWVTRAEQQRNMRANIIVQTPVGPMCLMDAARHHNVPYDRVRKRMRLGWPQTEWFK